MSLSKNAEMSSFRPPIADAEKSGTQVDASAEAVEPDAPVCNISHTTLKLLVLYSLYVILTRYPPG